MKRIISILFWIVALYSGIVCTFLLCNYFPRTTEFDYIGIIVGVLTILVTILMTWNIFSVVDISKKSEKIKSYIKESDTLRNSINEVRNESQAALFYLQGNARLNMKSCNQHLFTYYVYQTALWYALMQETSFSIGLVDSILKEMDIISEKIDKENNINNVIGKIEFEQLKNNMNDIVKSGNRRFNRVQREHFINISNTIKKIL